MYIAKILDSEATLNNFKEIGSLEFIGGEAIRVYMRLYNPQSGVRYIPPVTTLITITLNDSDLTEVEKTGTMLADDRSILYFDLTEEETNDIIGGNLKFELDTLGNGTVIKKGIVLNGLQKIIDC